VQWEAGGCVVGRLWVLPQRALATLCRGVGLSDEGDKVALVRRYADHCRATEAAAGAVLALTDAPRSAQAASGNRRRVELSSNGSATGSGRQRRDAADITQLDDHELPSNLHALEANQLAAVCAALGLPGVTADGKAALIATIERSRFRGRLADAGLDAGPRLLEERGAATAGTKRGRQQRLLTATPSEPTLHRRAESTGRRIVTVTEHKTAGTSSRREACSDSDSGDSGVGGDGGASSGGDSGSGDSEDSDVVFVPAAPTKRR
jgi:hypothetical protein